MEVAYIKWKQAKSNQDYKHADEIREDIAKKWGVVFAKVGDDLTISTPEEKKDTTAIYLSYYDWLKKYGDATPSYLELLSVSDSKYGKLYLGVSPYSLV